MDLFTTASSTMVPVKRMDPELVSSGVSTTEGSEKGSMDSPAERASSFYVPRTRSGAQPSIRSAIKKEEKEEADMVLGRMFFWGDLPLNITKTNPFFQPMCDAIAVVGPGYECPTYEELRGPILQAEKKDINFRLEQFKPSWEVNGCTVMSDSWTDGNGRTFLNFFVHCPKGTMFIKSVDASSHVKDAALLCELMDGLIQEIGLHNVVQIITDNATNYVTAGRLLMERHPTLFWTPCTAQCIDLMLEDMGKIPFVKKVIDQASSISKFIYKHAFVLSLMRRCTRNKELLHPAIMRFATNFISLQSLLQCQLELKQMFACDEWHDCAYSRREDGRAIARLLYTYSFWEGVEEVCSISEPLVKVLRLVDSDKPIMGYLYEAMHRAKKTIRSYYVGKGTLGYNKHMMLWELIDSRWIGMLRRPIHAAALFLNPAFSYKCNFDFDGEVMEGLSTCLHRMVPDADTRHTISREMEMYREASGLFSFGDAVHERTFLMPHVWWRTYGARVPNLRKFAIRVLSQTCSASGCERNWSVFEKIHSEKHNRLEFPHLDDLVYVHYNLRLWMRQVDKTPYVDAISLENIDVLSKWKVESEVPIVEEAPAWLEEQREEWEEEEEEEQLEDIMEGDAPTSAAPSTQIDVPSPTPFSHRQTFGAESGPSTARGRPSKQPMTFSRKRGRKH